jgi:glycosyltransferase involved in cell wall biosynthesis
MSSSKKPKVRVLLSTYNGEKFVEELIRSVLEQTGVEIEILIRDDGSSDNTIGILENLMSHNPEITLLQGQNIGVTSSFFELLKEPSEAEFFAFADQDDVWKPAKLLNAIQKLRQLQISSPMMYYSKLQFVDERLQHIGFSAEPTFSGYNNALVQNQATGCTIVLNSQAKELVVSKLPEWALMHDWWCYLVISAFGKVVYDTNSYILYRKHGKNVTPATPFFPLELLARIKRYLDDGKITKKVTDQVGEFKRLFYHDLSTEKKQLADEFLNVRNSNLVQRLVYILFKQKVKRNTRLDNLILKTLILFGKF